MRTVARRDGEDWVLNGTKLWITNGSIADVAVVWARTDERIRGFVVPTDTKGFSANEIHQKLSLRASVTSELVLQDVRLPQEAVLPHGAGLAGPLGCLNEARFGIIFGALGAARDSLAVAVDYATSRQVPGDSCQDARVGGFVDSCADARVKRCCAAWREMPSWVPIADHDAPV